MGKKMFLLIFLCITFTIGFAFQVTTAASETTVVSWDPYSSPGVTTLRLYRSVSSLTSQEAWDIPADQNQLEIDTPAGGLYFYSLYAVIEEDGGYHLSEPSNEVMILHCAQGHCNHYFNVVPTGDETVWIDFDMPSSINEWRLDYSTPGGGVTSVNMLGPMSMGGLEGGEYTFTLYAKDALGRAITTQSTYLPVTVTIEGAQTAPDAPVFGTESFGVTTNVTLAVAFDWLDTFVSHAIVDVYSSSHLRDSALINNTPGDIWADVTVPRGTNFCRTVNSTTHHIVFVRARVVDYNGAVSENATDYILFGNIVGTSWDGVPSHDAVINADDQAAFSAAFQAHSAVPYMAQSSDYCAEPNLYALMPFPEHEVADYNKNGLIDSWDHNYLRRGLLGRTGAGK